MLYSKVDKLLGTSTHETPTNLTLNGVNRSLMEDKPPVLPMPATMSPLAKSTFYRSTSSLSLRSSDIDKKSVEVHKYDQYSHTNQARRNALDPTNVSPYSQRTIHHDVRHPQDTSSHDLPFRSFPMSREYPPSTTANRQTNVQGWQMEVNLARTNSRSTTNLRKGELVYDTYPMQRRLSNAGSRPIEPNQEKMPEGHFIDPFYASKNSQKVEYESRLRKRSESFGQIQSPLSVGNLARADDERISRPFLPLRPLRTNESFAFGQSQIFDHSKTSANVNLSSKWSSASTDTHAYHDSLLTAGLSSPISTSSYLTSTPPSSATQSAFRSSTEMGKVISPTKSNAKTSPSVYSTHSFKSAQSEAFEQNSRRTKYDDVKMFPLVRREALRSCLMDENVTKVEAAVRKGLMRKKDINERVVVLTTNARQIQGQLSAKLASLTGAQSIGQAQFSFNDLNGQEPFVILHCFKSDYALAKEEERLTLSSHSFVAVAESSSSFHIDREVWALKIAGHITSTNPPKTRAAEQQQSQWTLQFDTKHRMLKWQVIIRSLIAGLNEADQVFRIGPPLHQIKHTHSTNSVSSASTLASSAGYQSVISHREKSESYEEMFGSTNSHRSSPRSPYSFNKDDNLSKYVTSISSNSDNGVRTSTFVASQTSQFDQAILTMEKDQSLKQYKHTSSSPPSPPPKQLVEHSGERKSTSIHAKDFAVEEKIKNDVISKSEMKERSEKNLLLAERPGPITQSRKRSASVPQFSKLVPERLPVESSIIVSPLSMSKQPATVNVPTASKNRYPSRPQQLPPPATPLPVVPPPPTAALPAIPPSSPTTSNMSHQSKQKAEEKLEDSVAENLRRMRIEIALAMACAAAPRSMSMTSSFTNFSEDIAELSKRCSTKSDVKNGNESFKESEHEEEETVDNRSDLKVDLVNAKKTPDEVDAIYAMIDLSYNIYGLSTTSNKPNVFVPNTESLNASSQTDGSNSVYFDEFASDPFKQMGTIKIDSASLQKARADVRNRSASISTEETDSFPGNLKLEKRKSSLKKKSVPGLVKTNDYIGTERSDSSSYKHKGSAGESGSTGTSPIGLAI